MPPKRKNNETAMGDKQAAAKTAKTTAASAGKDTKEKKHKAKPSKADKVIKQQAKAAAVDLEAKASTTYFIKRGVNPLHAEKLVFRRQRKWRMWTLGRGSSPFFLYCTLAIGIRAGMAYKCEIVSVCMCYAMGPQPAIYYLCHFHSPFLSLSLPHFFSFRSVPSAPSITNNTQIHTTVFSLFLPPEHKLQTTTQIYSNPSCLPFFLSFLSSLLSLSLSSYITSLSSSPFPSLSLHPFYTETPPDTYTQPLATRTQKNKNELYQRHSQLFIGSNRELARIQHTQTHKTKDIKPWETRTVHLRTMALKQEERGSTPLPQGTHFTPRNEQEKIPMRSFYYCCFYELQKNIYKVGHSSSDLEAWHVCVGPSMSTWSLVK
ncbi:MAG: hypothetical protein J3R72DRAFT_84857 [Linnemannia gamsii]|nr:MAG: hypothetical protein J3R72DRAFT_84857 [Linnemannia gamsii]